MLPGWLLEAVGNGGPRGMVIARQGVTRGRNRTRLMGCFGQFFFEYPMNDRDRWNRAIAAVSAEFASLSPAVRDRMGAVAGAIRQVRRELQGLAGEMDSAAICASCGGECCRRGKYHVTVADILVFLAEEEPLFTPCFDRDACPYLDDHGCMMEPSLRPFPCITFNCERVEGLWEPARVEAFYRGERQLSALYGELERLFTPPAGEARRVAILGYGNNPERCIHGDNDQ